MASQEVSQIPESVLLHLDAAAVQGRAEVVELPSQALLVELSFNRREVGILGVH